MHFMKGFVMSKQYIPLHAHNSHGSIGDALMKLKDYANKAKEYGLPAIAMTDHGTLTSMYAFNEYCSQASIKPIFGCEVYEVRNRLELTVEGNERRHLLLLAKNETGLKNLLSIVNNSYLEGFYYKPRTDLVYMKEHGEGIIATSACISSKLSKAIVAELPQEELVAMIEEYKSVFDEFYLEIQPGRIDEQYIVNDALVELSALTNTPLVVTNDIHYLEKTDFVLHDAHVKIARKKPFDGPREYSDDCYWFMDYDTVFNAFEGRIDEDILTEAIENTVRIADKCNVELSKEIHLPQFDESHPVRILSEKCFDRLDEMKDMINEPQVYVSRLLYELDVIEKLGFVDYFLMVQDFLNHARSEGIAVGPGRGSVGGSLVAYLLNITVADPIQYNLLFERFLSPHRPGLPDIDLDFDSSRREEMFQYVVGKYGEDNCSLVSTFMMRKSRSGIKDVARILEIPLDVSEKISKLIPQVYYEDDGEKLTDLSIEDAIRAVPELQEYYREYPELFDMASRISDVPSSQSTHAAGMLIAPFPLGNLIPIIPTKKGIRATALPLSDVEEAGLVKMDFLSLASLNVYEKTQQDVGIHIDLNTLDYHDEKVWNLIGSKYTTGLFQISSKTYKSRMGRLKPKSIQELAHCLALLRGPCISTGADKDYMEILEGKKAPAPIHEAYWKVTGDTQGILLYQEQIMALAVEFGFTLEEGYKLMKGVSKKKMEVIMSWKEKFFDKASAAGAEEDQIEQMWHMIEVSGQYSFNQAHAVCYAILSYVSAYLKTYYPKEFLKNLLTNAYVRKKKEEVVEAVEDCRRMGFKFLPPDINKSDYDFSIEDGMLRIGLCAVKGFGDQAASELIKHRPYSNLKDVMSRVSGQKCGKRAMIPLIFSNAFHEIATPIEIYQEYCAARKEEPLDEIRLQSKEVFSPLDDLDRLEEVFMITPLTADPANELPSFGFHEIKESKTFEAEVVLLKVKKHKDKSGNQMAFATLGTGDGYIEATVFSNVFKKYGKELRKNNRVLITAKKDGMYSCVINKVG